MDIPRIFSFGRGDPRCVWIFGKRVSATADELRHDATFEQFLADGFPAALAEKLGAATVASVRDAVEALAPLACMCDTGAQTVDQHGTVTCSKSEQEFMTLILTGQCTVCGRRWRFEESGDPYYEMHYTATEIKSS
jgi:hypothetical protein